VASSTTVKRQRPLCDGTFIDAALVQEWHNRVDPILTSPFTLFLLDTLTDTAILAGFEFGQLREPTENEIRAFQVSSKTRSRSNYE
jgi:hypothetical protein